MSVIIKGYDAVNYCNECEFSFPQFRGDFSTAMNYCCSLKDKVCHNEYYQKPEDCPIIPLPEKHGRLVDADKIIESMDEMKVEGEVFVTAVEYVKITVEEAETVIPAEKGD